MGLFWLFSGYFLGPFGTLERPLGACWLVDSANQQGQAKPGLCALASWEVAIVRVSYAYWDFLRDWEVGIKYVKSKDLKFLVKTTAKRPSQNGEVFHLTYTPSSDVQGLPHDFDMTQLRLTSDRSRFSYK